MFRPQRRADNKQWKRKDQKCPCIAKRTISSKEMLYAIFINSSGPVVQMSCPSGHTVTGPFYKNSVLMNVKEFTEQFRKLINRYKIIGYSLDIMRQIACLVVNPIIVDGYASLFNCTTAVRASDSMTASS